MAKINPPIRYFGGKNNMFNDIVKHFPAKGSYDTYIEPFGGSYGIGLKTQEDTPIEIYNDLERNVYSLYKVMNDKELFSEFKEKCDLCIYSEYLRNEYRLDLRTKGDELSLVDRAFRFFYVNRTSHNGIGGFSINNSIRRNMSKSVSDFLSTVDRMKELHQRLSKLIVTNRNGIELIERYNTENVFIYADPPYLWDTRGSARYSCDMDNDTHEDFIKACIGSNAKILISGYDNEMYERLVENGFEKIHFEVKTIDAKRSPKTKVETLWKNY